MLLVVLDSIDAMTHHGKTNVDSLFGMHKSILVDVPGVQILGEQCPLARIYGIHLLSLDLHHKHLSWPLNPLIVPIGVLQGNYFCMYIIGAEHFGDKKCY